MGTFALLFMGCAAMLVRCSLVNGGGCLLTALAFGLGIIGERIVLEAFPELCSPVVSVGVLLRGAMKAGRSSVWAFRQGLYGSNTLAGVGRSAAFDRAWRFCRPLFSCRLFLARPRKHRRMAHPAV